MKKRSMLMNEIDSGAVVLENIEIGDIVEVYDSYNGKQCEIEAKEKILFGNKIAVKDVFKGEYIYKYGEKIGKASKDIKKGKLIHVHNVESLSVDIPESAKKEIIKQMGIEEN